MNWQLQADEEGIARWAQHVPRLLSSVDCICGSLYHIPHVVLTELTCPVQKYQQTCLIPALQGFRRCKFDAVASGLLGATMLKSIMWTTRH